MVAQGAPFKSESTSGRDRAPASVTLVRSSAGAEPRVLSRSTTGGTASARSSPTSSKGWRAERHAEPAQPPRLPGGAESAGRLRPRPRRRDDVLSRSSDVARRAARLRRARLGKRQGRTLARPGHAASRAPSLRRSGHDLLPGGTHRRADEAPSSLRAPGADDCRGSRARRERHLPRQDVAAPVHRRRGSALSLRLPEPKPDTRSVVGYGAGVGRRTRRPGTRGQPEPPALRAHRGPREPRASRADAGAAGGASGSRPRSATGEIRASPRISGGGLFAARVS